MSTSLAPAFRDPETALGACRSRRWRVAPTWIGQGGGRSGHRGAAGLPRNENNSSIVAREMPQRPATSLAAHPGAHQRRRCAHPRPAQQRRQRRFREVQRRTRPMGAFQDRTSMDRILFAIFIHENKQQGISTLRHINRDITHYPGRLTARNDVWQLGNVQTHMNGEWPDGTFPSPRRRIVWFEPSLCAMAARMATSPASSTKRSAAACWTLPLARSRMPNRQDVLDLIDEEATALRSGGP